MLHVCRSIHLRVIFFALFLSVFGSACGPQIFGIRGLAGSSNDGRSTFSLINTLAGEVYFSGGAGIPSSPFLICTRDEFLAMSFVDTTGKYFKQTCDIDMGGAATPLSPLPVFKGDYNGDHYTISNLVVNSPEFSDVGLFQTLSSGSLVHDLKITGAKIYGYQKTMTTWQNAGVIAGQSEGKVSAVVVTDSRVSCVGGCGGLIGVMKGASEIKSSFFDGHVSGPSYDVNYSNTQFGVGGLVGYVDAAATGTIEKSFTRGTLSGAEEVGGLVGESDSATIKIQENISAHQINTSPFAVWGAFSIGSLIGAGNGVVQNNFAVGSLVNNSQPGGSSIGGLVGSEFAPMSKNYAALLGLADYGAASDFKANGTTGQSFYYKHAKILAPTFDAGDLDYAHMTDSASVAANFPGFDFTNIWNLPDVALSYPFPQLKSFAFSSLHTFEMTTYTPLQISETAPGTGFGTPNSSDLGTVDSSLTLTNTSGGSITIDSMEMAMGFDFTFQSGSSTCVLGPLAPAATCTMVIRIEPSKISAYEVSDALILSYTDNGISRKISTQVQVAINLDDGIIVDANYQFPVTKVGNSQSSKTLSGNASITLNNPGGGNVANINSITSNLADFTLNIGTSTCLVGGSVGAVGSCLLDVAFAPSTSGTRSGIITIDYTTASGITKQAHVFVEGTARTGVDGSLTNPFEVWNDVELAGMDLNGKYIQMADIDLSKYTCPGFKAAQSGFGGSYDGQDFTISNFCGDAALFGNEITGVTFKNMKLNHFTISAGSAPGGSYSLGALVGDLIDSQLDQIHVTDVQITSAPASVATIWPLSFGGLVGFASGTNLTNCSVSGNSKIEVAYAGGAVSGAIGGLTGYLTDRSVNDSFSNADVTTIPPPAMAGAVAGGLLGTWKASIASQTITDSYATGSVSSIASSAGGLIGSLKSTAVGSTQTIQRSFATGSVEGIYAGGLVAANSDASVNLTVEESFASGDVTASHSASGFIDISDVAGGPGGGAAVWSVRNSFASGAISSDLQASGFVHAMTGGIGSGDLYTSVPSVTDAGHPGGDGWAMQDVTLTPGDDYYYWESGVGYPDPGNGEVSLNTAQMENQASFPGLNFPGKWRMPVDNLFSPVNSPVPAWLCGKHGITCY